MLATIDDYLLWRGDLDFSERPFNDVDNLVCSVISYLDLSGFVPREGEEGAATVRDACQGILDASGTDISRYVKSMANIQATTLERLARSKRFGALRLHDALDVFEPARSLQVGAVTIDISDTSSYVSFRGTDNTLVGWQEDFMLSFQVTEAQAEAARYLEKRAERAQREGRRLFVGGHSKGGNLASYAAAALPEALRPTILFCWSNDGPGMDAAVVPESAWDVLGHRFLRIQPQYSIVGMLFDRPEEPRIYVPSTQTGVLQHDPTSWLVGPCAFETAPDLLPECKVTNSIFADWIASVPYGQRREFTTEFFQVLQAGGATTLDEVTAAPDGIQKVVQALGETSPATKDAIMKLVGTTVTNTFTAARQAASRAMETAAENAARLAESWEQRSRQARLVEHGPEDPGHDRDHESAPEGGAEALDIDAGIEDGHGKIAGNLQGHSVDDEREDAE